MTWICLPRWCVRANRLITDRSAFAEANACAFQNRIRQNRRRSKNQHMRQYFNSFLSYIGIVCVAALLTATVFGIQQTQPQQQTKPFATAPTVVLDVASVAEKLDPVVVNIKAFGIWRHIIGLGFCHQFQGVDRHQFSRHIKRRKKGSIQERSRQRFGRPDSSNIAGRTQPARRRQGF